jgi:dCTP diphosphatase
VRVGEFGPERPSAAMPAAMGQNGDGKPTAWFTLCSVPHRAWTELRGGTNVTEIASLREQLRAFAAARDWEQFHSPKNLAMALSAEAGELLEIFQWLSEDQSRRLTSEALAATSDEVADVLLYLIRLCDQLGIDPIVAANRKLVANAAKYPADKARGNSKKYTEL